MAEIIKYFADATGHAFAAPFATQDAADAYTPPDGVSAISDPPAATGYEWTNGAWAAVTPPAVTGDQVDAERQRRRFLPLSVTVPSGTFTVNMDEISQANIQGLSTVGLYLQGAGSAQTTTFRDYNNTSHDLTPADLVALGLAVAAHIQALYVASWALKAQNPIPADYAADSNW